MIESRTIIAHPLGWGPGLSISPSTRRGWALAPIHMSGEMNASTLNVSIIIDGEKPILTTVNSGFSIEELRSFLHVHGYSCRMIE